MSSAPVEMLLWIPQARPEEEAAGWRRALEARFVVETVHTAEDASRILRNALMQAAVIDLAADDRSPSTIIWELWEIAPLLPIVLLARPSDHARIVEGMRAGAVDFVYMGDPRLVEAVEQAITGRHLGLGLPPGRVSFLEHILNALPHPVFVVDAWNYRVRLANEAARRAAHEPNPTCHALFHRSDRPCSLQGFACPLEIIRRTRRPVTVEHRHALPNGGARMVQVTGYPVFDDAGTLTHMVEYCVELSQRREYAEALREAREEVRSGQTESRGLYAQLQASEQEMRALYEQLKASEAELRESERMLSTLLSNLPGMAYRCLNDPQWTMQFVSEGCLSLTGYPAPALLGNRLMSYADLIHEEDRDRVWEEVQHAVARRQAFMLEYRIIAADGELKYVIEQGRGVEDAEGNLVALEGFIGDISELQRSREALRNSEEHFRTLIENASDIISILDEEGRFRYQSPSMQRVLGYAPGRLTGQRAGMLTHPDDAPRLDAMIAQALREVDVPISIEARIQDSDGIYRTMEVIGRGVLDALGRRIVVNARDISERKRAEEERSRLINAIENLDETIVITDVRGYIQYVNPAFERVTGYAAADALGKRPSVLKSGKHDDAFYQQLWSTINRGEVWRGHFVNRRKDGALYEEDGTIAPVRGRDGQIINFVAVKRDVTKEVALQARLRQLQKLEAIGTLAGGIAHDFNNILLPILGYSELVLAGLPEDSGHRAPLENVLAACRRGRDLVYQILTFSGGIATQHHPVDMYSTVDEALKLLRATIPTTIEFVRRLDKAAGVVLADPGQIHQIVMNLCTNAYQAMTDSGGTLVVELNRCDVDAEFARDRPQLKPDHPYVRLTVSDSGCGIPPEALERIFDPFYTTKATGTGLGLATVHGIVSELDGYIGVYSEAGKGTTFHVYFPRTAAEPGPSAADHGRIPLGAGEHVLLVDDEASNVRLLELLLGKLGYRTTPMTDGVATLSEFRARPDDFDLVITDQTMPKMTGSELAHELRKVRPDIPIILTSGLSESLASGGDHKPGGIFFIQKPFTQREIAHVMRRAIDGEPSA